MLHWLMLALLSLFLFTGCGDLEPEMQDTRTVILKMDLHEKSSSRTSQVSAADIAAYQTHFILALTKPYWESITSSYKDYFYSSIAHNLMDPQSRKTKMEIPINTDMKIFAFLFSGKYSEYELIMWDREVGYYGESRSFTISKDTDSLELGIRLIQATTNTGTDTSAPTVTFSPSDGATEVAISSNITITFDEAMRNTDDMPLTDSDIDSLITLKNDAYDGYDIAFDATIDASKKVITIVPTYYFSYLQTVYVAISASVEDSSGNPITASSATFTAVQYLQY